MKIDALFLGGTSIDLIQDRNRERRGLNFIHSRPQIRTLWFDKLTIPRTIPSGVEGKGADGAWPLSISLQETAGFSPRSFIASIGGSITNSSIIAAKLGLRTALLSRIGKDLLGDYAKTSLASFGIDAEGIIQDSGIRTPLAIAKIDKSGNARYAFYKNSPKDSIVPIKNVPKYILNTCKVFHTGSSYSYHKETFEETLKFIKYLKKRGVFICYDPNIRPYTIKKHKNEVKSRVFRLLNEADLAKLSEIDLDYLTGQKSPLKALKTLKNRVKSELVLTLGPKGSIYCYQSDTVCRRRRHTVSDVIKVPAFKVKIADTIGAGDAFTAGLIYKLIKQGRAKFFNNMRANMIFASAVSALICMKKGANQGLENIKQLNSFLSK